MIQKLLQQTEQFIEMNSVKEFEELLSILKFSNITEDEHEALNNKVLKSACINLHFHPDRYLSADKQIIDGLIETGQYKNQFQTKISSGSLTAKSGGDREVWENKLFDNFYAGNAQDRPKYGSLNLTYTSDGASPRFGSCYFVTNPEIKNRCTFTYGDSYLLPKERGVAKNLTQIYARLYQDVFTRNTALGSQYESLRDFFKRTTSLLDLNRLIQKRSHNLDFYIEAQVHGYIDLRKDISALVADESFKGTKLENRLRILCEKFDISLIWNPGYQLKDNAFPDDFRGIETKIFAKKIADNGLINAYIIGKALSDDEIKSQYNSLHLFQLAKYIWHCLVKFG